MINTIRTEILKSAKLTGLWENKLRRIERGTFEAAEFINEIKTMVDQVVLTVLADNSAQRILTDQKATETNKKVGEAGKKGGEAAPKRKRNVTPSPKTFEEIACPVCGTGHLIKGNAAVGCSNFRNGCRFVIPFADLGKTVSAASVSRYLKNEQSDMVQTVIVILILAACAVYIAVRIVRRYRRPTDCTDSRRASGCSTCDADCPLKRPR